MGSYRTARKAVLRRAIQVFRRLPPKVRRPIVRLGTPNYTIGSVVLLRDHDDRLLLLQQPPQPGWSLPGGLLDKHEHPRDGGARELREETGVALPSEALTPIVPNAHVNPWVQEIDMVFTATVDSDATEVQVDGVEIQEAQWYSLDALPPLTGPTFRLLGRAGLVSGEGTPERPNYAVTEPEESP
ncbi:NUDIX hydrolase [Cryptosporangium sp. NPDC051539]|uniref:NUDIX hydrolase n=1 Tax=Cryptosporangium sp. NPDC051539 TaxID=3363962 RepID=UPI00379C0DFD